MRIIDYPQRLSTRTPTPERKLALENVARQVKRIAVEREHERRNAEDLAFLEWVKGANLTELADRLAIERKRWGPFTNHLGAWELRAIERELARRARSV